MTKTTLKERVEAAKQKITLSPETQTKIVNLVKEQVSAQLTECAEYYQELNSSIDFVYTLNSAKSSLKDSSINGVFELYSVLYNNLHSSELPYECNRIFTDALLALSSSCSPKFGDTSFPHTEDYTYAMDLSGQVSALANNDAHPAL